MNQTKKLFFLKGNLKDFLEAHQEFTTNYERCYEYLAEGYKNPMLLVKSKIYGSGRWRFSIDQCNKTAYVAKLMVLYAEGWIDIEDMRQEDSKSLRRITDSEWEAVLEMRERKKAEE